MKNTITLDHATAIKARLWLGETPEAVAPSYGLSAVAVRFILNGKRWVMAPWPKADNAKKFTYGAMPDWRRKEIAKARKLARQEIREAHNAAIAARLSK